MGKVAGAPAGASGGAAQEGPGHVNEVRLVGRLPVDPVHRTLPSGDELVSFRLVVERAAKGRRTPGTTGTTRTPTVDTVDCAAWRRDVQRIVSRAVPGEVLEVSGALRRRFWRTGTGAASRSEVEVSSVRRLR